MTHNVHTGQSGPSLISLSLHDYLASQIAAIYWFHTRIYKLSYYTSQNCNYCFCHETMAVYVPECCVRPHTFKSLQTRPCCVQSDKVFKVPLLHFEKQHSSQKKPGRRSAASLIQTRYSMFGDVSSSHLLADHLIPLAVWLTDIPLFCLPSLR